MQHRHLSRRFFLKVAGLGAAAAVLSACSGSTPPAAPAATPPAQQGGSTTPSPAGQAQQPAAPGPISLSWAAWVTGPVDASNMAQKTLKDKFNADIQFLAFERATWQDQINTRVAGGTIPDIIYRESVSQVQQYVDQGILAEIPYEAVRDNAKQTFLAENDFTTDVWLATAYQSKNWGVPLMQPSQMHPFTDGWRKDWLDKVGISKLPETLDEFEAAFTKFVKDDPDGNGAADTYALTGRGKDAATWTFYPFYSAYGTYPNMWMEVSKGVLQYGATTDEARKAMTLLQKWYKMGLIDPEFVTVDGKALTQKWSNGKVGYCSVSTWYRLIPGGEHYDGLKAANPKAEIAMAIPPKGPDGKFGYFNWGPVTSSITFGKQLQGDKLKRALQIIEGVTTDADLSTMVRYGKEGEHWQRDPQTNAVLFKAPYDKPENRGPLGVNFFAAMPPSPKIQSLYARKDEPQLYAKAEMNNVKNFVPYASLFMTDVKTVSKQTTEVGPTVDRWTLDFITGQKSMDQWDAFIQDYNNAGGKILVDSINNGYKTGAQEIQRIKDAVSKL